MVIIGKRTGQLGNRLFVFAHMIANAIEYGYEVHNPSFYSYARFFTGTRDDFFCRFPPRASRFHSAPLQKLYYRLISSCVLPFSGCFRGSNLLNISFLDINPKNYPEACYDMNNPDYIRRATSNRVLLLKDTWLFRDFVNINKHADRVRTFFTPVEQHSSAVSRLISGARNGCELLVGVHIRQGDYQRWQGGRYFYRTSDYAAVMGRFAATMPEKNVKFLICSNEKQNEKLFQGLNYVMGSNHPLEDMYAFAQCDFLIGPPSTYTAWASFYGSVPLHVLHTVDDAFCSDDFQVAHG